ncbi:alpha/beta hydrolase family esterase [Roseibium limicola]|nr:hypothetical protein [Roseibium limicola]
MSVAHPIHPSGLAGSFSAVFLGIVACLGMATATRADPDCGGEVACQVDGPMSGGRDSGTYYVYLPDDVRPQQPVGAIFFLHGHRGKALNEIRNGSFRKLADVLGVAFVAVDGLQGSWSFPTSPRDLRDEPAFFDAVIEDLTTRFPVDRDKLMLSGFSSGAFMTWYLACDDSQRFAGYAPIAGAFWEPLPEACPTSTPYLYHVHGTSDKVVPLAGRTLGGGQYQQGDVYESFEVWLRAAGLTLEDGKTITQGALNCTTWRPEEGALELCLHSGGHSVRAQWLKRAWVRLGMERGWIVPQTVGVTTSCTKAADAARDAGAANAGNKLKQAPYAC